MIITIWASLMKTRAWSIINSYQLFSEIFWHLLFIRQSNKLRLIIHICRIFSCCWYVAYICKLFNLAATFSCFSSFFYTISSFLTNISESIRSRFGLPHLEIELLKFSEAWSKRTESVPFGSTAFQIWINIGSGDRCSSSWSIEAGFTWSEQAKAIRDNQYKPLSK